MYNLGAAAAAAAARAMQRASVFRLEEEE